MNWTQYQEQRRHQTRIINNYRFDFFFDASLLYSHSPNAMTSKGRLNRNASNRRDFFPTPTIWSNAAMRRVEKQQKARRRRGKKTYTQSVVCCFFAICRLTYKPKQYKQKLHRPSQQQWNTQNARAIQKHRTKCETATTTLIYQRSPAELCTYVPLEWWCNSSAKHPNKSYSYHHRVELMVWRALRKNHATP